MAPMLVPVLFAWLGTTSVVPPPIGQTPDVKAYIASQSACRFTENKGQWNSKAKFVARSRACDMWVTSQGIVYDWHEKLDAPEIPFLGNGNDFRTSEAVFVDFVGAQGQGKPEGIQALPGPTRYYLDGHNALVHSYKAATIKDLYKGIDLVAYFDERASRPRYDLIVHPGADAVQIRMRYRGANDFKVVDGQVRYKVNDGIKVEEQREVAYQRSDAGPDFRFVPRQVLNADKTVSFDVAGYKKDRTLVIDPLVWSTYLGGDLDLTEVQYIDVDASNNVYVAGFTDDKDFPTSPAVTLQAGLSATFAAKFNSTGQLQYSVVLGGSLQTHGYGVGSDSTGNLYIVGITNNTSLPVTDSTGGLASTTPAFLGKIKPDGSFQYLTLYQPGGGVDSSAVSVSPSGIATMAASTASTAVAVQYDASGTPFTTSTVFGTGACIVFGVAVDSLGAILVTGVSSAGTLVHDGGTVYSGFMNTNPNSGYDTLYATPFVSKTTPGGTSPDQETYMGGIGGGSVAGIHLDSTDNVFIAGTVAGPDNPQSLAGVHVATTFPTTAGAFNSGPPPDGPFSGYVAKLSNDLTTNLASTICTGGSRFQIEGFALDSAGSPMFVGIQGGGIPLTYDYFSGRSSFSYLMRLSSDLSTEVYGSYFADPFATIALACAVDGSGRYYVGGETFSATFPTTPGAFQSSYPGGQDGFVSVIDPTVTIGLVSVHTDRGTNPAISGGSGRVLNVSVNLVEPLGTQVFAVADHSGLIHVNGQADFAIGTVSDASHVLTFQVTANDTPTDEHLNLVISLGPQSFSVPITIKPFLNNIVVRALSVVGGTTATLYVYPYETPATDQIVSVSTNLSSGAVTPTTVTIKGLASGGTTGATVQVLQTPVVATDTAVALTVSHTGGSSAGVSFTLLGPDVSTISFSPASVVAGQSSSVTAKLKAAYPTDLTFNLTSSNPAAAPGLSVFIPTGQLSGTATVATNTFPGKGAVTVRFGGIASSPTVSGGLVVSH